MYINSRKSAPTTSSRPFKTKRAASAPKISALMTAETGAPRAEHGNGNGRVKLYAPAHCTLLACIGDAVAFGGYVTEVALEGLRRQKSVWHFLLNGPAYRHDAHPVAVESFGQSINFNWEVLERHNDLEAKYNLSSISKKLNWHDWMAVGYEHMLRWVSYALDSADPIDTYPD
ncbi:hypothetical protein LY76DRAFT_606459 [Colletotrichum caudatum]|nr:hypothetical protein LY76DRAFT_606459 [Colletotrichum caudatum]